MLGDLPLRSFFQTYPHRANHMFKLTGDTSHDLDEPVVRRTELHPVENNSIDAGQHQTYQPHALQAVHGRKPA